MVRSLLLVAFSLVAAATSVAAGATQRDDTCAAEICGLTPTPTTANVVERVDPAGHMNNAERLARGLPLAKPRRRFHSGTPVVKARDSSIPSVPYRAMIQVSDGGNVLGYISRDYFSSAQSRYQDITSAAIFDFSLPAGQTTGNEIELTVENLDNQLPNSGTFFGMIQGRDSTSTDISAGSYNYGYFGSVAHTDAGSSAQAGANSYTTATGKQRDIESSVWSVDVIAGTISAQWINSNQQPANTVLFTQSTALYFGGDEGAFHNKYPAPVTPMTFKLVLL